MESNVVKLDVMIDIETLGNTSSAQILTISAITFDPFTNSNLIADMFYRTIDLDSYQKYENRFTFDKSTLLWWMKQEKQVRKEAFSGEYTIEEVMKEFVDWCFLMQAKYEKDIKVWSHGASFDISILRHALSVLQLEIPWNYKNIRDTRTLFDLAQVDLNTIGDIPIRGVIFPRHHAMGDCARQIEGVRLSYKKLRIQ